MAARPEAPDPHDFVPLKSRAFHIMLVLADGDRHGYAIKQKVEEISGGVLRMGPGTLYESIQRLEKERLDRRISGPPPTNPRTTRSVVTTDSRRSAGRCSTSRPNGCRR